VLDNNDVAGSGSGSVAVVQWFSDSGSGSVDASGSSAVYASESDNSSE
jgi:hypothetical protein